MSNYIDWRGFKANPDNLPEHRPGVYLFTNLEDPKKHYVGAAGDVHDRVKSHSKGGSPRKFKTALTEFGLGSFLVEPIYYWTAGDHIELLIVEAINIQEYDSIKNGYNVAQAGASVGPYGAEFAAIIKAANTTPKMQALWKRLWADPAYRARQLKSHAETYAKPEVKAQLRIAHTGKHAHLHNPDNLAKRTVTCRTPAHRQKMSDISVAMWADPVFKVLLSDVIREGFNKPGVREHLSSAISAALHTPEGHAKRVTEIIALNARPEVRAKHAARVSNLVWITNSLKNQRIARELPIPEGWSLGRATRWITDGSSSKMLAAGANMPEGWQLGRTLSTLNGLWISDGKTVRKIPQGSVIPEGWQRGGLKWTP
jgi:hypothetical protein